ncbi:restriction endonuclease subunit S [Waltera acetigignens]|uniref:Restriction endonuclease subunit S n=2 Tax=Waltera TaxID=2815781 RepID=A0AAE3D695_9FIRM|nr:restriction endonuclease subunit S [Brotolimicola acetigignens]MCC2118277.1 restriction endonuclease subunit S [Brotolimicola acetigignens]
MTGQQLKNSILQMAVQGKLVPQDPNDEPASVLLERIRKEKEQLIKDGKIKKEKNPSYIFRGADNLPYEKVGKNELVCIADEVPFEIPESWEWVRLGELFQHNTGKALNSSNRSGKLLTYITTSNLYWNRFEIDNLREMYFSEAEIQKCTAIKGDFLVCEGGDIGRAAIWSYDTDIRIQNHIHRLRPYYEICVEYYYYIFFLYKHAGWIGGKGIGIQGLSSNALHSLLFPLPPLQEQRRIVIKIKETAPFVDKYEQIEQHLNDLNVKFPEMLKKSILQEAVQGKLVSQDPSDEPASVLLERIRAEKERLIQEGKIKRDKHESIIYRRDNSHYEKLDGIERCIDDEIPFDIPENWVWARFGTAMINRDAERIPLSVNEREKLQKIYDYYGASGVIDKVDRYLFSTPLLLIGEDGANLLTRSKPIAFIAKGQYWVNNHAHVIDSSDGLLLEYVAVYINAINLAPYVTGTAQPKMNQEKMNSILIPIPPTGEQFRIVQKINQIFSVVANM